MTPDEIRTRRVGLGLTQAELGALLWDNPKSGRVTIAKLETGAWPITRRTAAWLEQELRRLEAARTP
jgi:transcriptional regulator with XRE-family HTH domain